MDMAGHTASAGQLDSDSTSARHSDSAGQLDLDWALVSPSVELSAGKSQS